MCASSDCCESCGQGCRRVFYCESCSCGSCCSSRCGTLPAIGESYPKYLVLVSVFCSIPIVVLSVLMIMVAIDHEMEFEEPT